MLPWVVAFGAVQVGLRIGGRLLARRLDVGDELSSEIRRVRTFDQVVIAPISAALSRLRFDVAFAGVDADLTHAKPAPGGVDLTMNCAFAGGDIRIPREWRVAWDRRGPTGVNIKRGEPIEKAAHPESADLRVHVRGLFGGVGLKT